MNSNINQAMILAAGEGTRLRPLTLEMPKAILPINEVPLIDYILCWLKSYGINQVVINTHHLANKLMEYLGNGASIGVDIVYSQEDTPLGTAGGVKRMEQFFNDTFIVVHGDMLIDFDLAKMVRFHQEKVSLVTMAISNVSDPWEYGAVRLRADGQIVYFREKPSKEISSVNTINAGIYVLEKDALNCLPEDCFCDFALDIFPRMLALELPLFGYMLNDDDYAIDIGTIENYRKADRDAKAGIFKSPTALVTKVSY